MDNRLANAQRRFTLNSNAHAAEFNRRNSTRHQRAKSMDIKDGHARDPPRPRMPGMPATADAVPGHRRSRSTGIVNTTIDADYHHPMPTDEQQPRGRRGFLGINFRRSKSQSGRRRSQHQPTHDEHGRSRTWTKEDVDMLEELTAIAWAGGQIVNFNTISKEMNRTAKDVQEMLRQQMRTLLYVSGHDFLSEFPRAIVLQWAGIEFPDDPLLGSYAAQEARKLLMRESCISSLLCRAPRQVIPEVPIIANTRFDRNRVPGDLYDEIRAQDTRYRAQNALQEVQHNDTDLRSSRTTQRVVTEPSAVLHASSANVAAQLQSAFSEKAATQTPKTTRNRSKSTLMPKDSDMLRQFHFSAAQPARRPAAIPVSVSMQSPLSATFGLAPRTSELAVMRRAADAAMTRPRRRRSRSHAPKVIENPDAQRALQATSPPADPAALAQPAEDDTSVVTSQPPAGNRVSQDSGHVDDRTCGSISLVHKLRELKKYSTINSDHTRRLDRDTRYTVRRAVSEFLCQDELGKQVFDHVVTNVDNSLFMRFSRCSDTLLALPNHFGEAFRMQVVSLMNSKYDQGMKAYSMAMYAYVLEAINGPDVIDRPRNWGDISDFALEWANRKLSAARYISTPAMDETHLRMAAYHAGSEAGQCFYDMYRRDLGWRVSDRELHLFLTDEQQTPSGERTKLDLQNLKHVIDVWVDVAFRRNASKHSHLTFAAAAELVNINMVLTWGNLKNESDIAEKSLTFDRNCLEVASLYGMDDMKGLPDSSVANELARAFARKFYDNNRAELFQLVLCQHQFIGPDYDEFADWVALGYGWAGGGIDYNILFQLNQYLLSMGFKPIRKYWDTIKQDVVISLLNLVHHSNTSFDWHTVDGFLWPREHADKNDSTTGQPLDPTESTTMAIGYNRLLGPGNGSLHISLVAGELPGDTGASGLSRQRTIKRLDPENASLVHIPDLAGIVGGPSLADQRRYNNPNIDAPEQAESSSAKVRRRHTTFVSEATTVTAPGGEPPVELDSIMPEDSHTNGRQAEYDSPSASVSLRFSRTKQILDTGSPTRSGSAPPRSPESFSSALTSNPKMSGATSAELPPSSTTADEVPPTSLPVLTSQPAFTTEAAALPIPAPKASPDGFAPRSDSSGHLNTAAAYVSLPVHSKQEMIETAQASKPSAFSHYKTTSSTQRHLAGAAKKPKFTLKRPASPHNQEVAEAAAGPLMPVQSAPDDIQSQASQVHGSEGSLQEAYRPVQSGPHSVASAAAAQAPAGNGYATPHMLQQSYAYPQYLQAQPLPPQYPQYSQQPAQPPQQPTQPPQQSISSPQFHTQSWQSMPQPQYYQLQQHPPMQYALQQRPVQYAPQQPEYAHLQQYPQGYQFQAPGQQPAQTGGYPVQPMGQPGNYPTQPIGNLHLAHMNDAEWERYKQRMEYQVQLAERLQRAQNQGWGV